MQRQMFRILDHEHQERVATTMRAQRVGLILALLILRAGPVRVQAQEKPASEKQTIEALIKHVENMKDATFIRNDKQHDAKTAARFLRGKWEANEAEIKTAKDFIEKCASISTTTGKPYIIQFKDGKRMKSGDYLRAELKKTAMSSGDKRGP
jgi:tRNA C32,U32 (ribose-2'-O)-methylase TrmJ